MWVPVGAGPPGGAIPFAPAPPPLPMLPSLDALCSRAVVDILQNAERADTLVFVGFHAACTKMCELEGVANLGQLGAHDPAAQVPLLGRILQIEQMSTAFVGSYIAQRSIVTMRDMERELVAFLRSYNLQPRTETLGGVTRFALDLATNSEEISLDDPDENNDDTAVCDEHVRVGFRCMGVGSLAALPVVAAAFGPPPPASSATRGADDGTAVRDDDDTAVRQLDPLAELAEFLENRAASGTNRLANERRGVSLGAAFEAHLATKLAEKLAVNGGGASSSSRTAVSVLRERGILVRHDSLRRERACAAHVGNALRAEARRAREDALRAEADAELAATRAARARARAGAGPLSAPRLAPPASSDALAFIEETRRAGGFDPRWRPSRSKVLAAASTASSVLTQDAAFAAAAEYAALHLCGGKYRAKAFEPPSDDDDDDGSGASIESSSGSSDDDDGDDDDDVDDVDGDDDGDDDDDAKKEEEDAGVPPAKRSKSEGRSKPCWEGRMGSEFRGASATGHHAPVPDDDVHDDGPLNPDPKPAVTTVGYDELAGCLPWWGEAEVSDNRRVGRWGEALVYRYLLQRHPGWTVTWVNEHAESKSFYDVKMRNVRDGRIVFVEVKTTRSADKNAFEVSPWEWDFACKPGVEYHVYRVYSAGERGRTRITIVRNPAKLVREHAISMALAI